MGEFLQAYGFWIVFGLFFVFMLRMHAGGGCGAGHGSHQQPSDARREPTVDDSEQEEPGAAPARPPTGRGSDRHH